MSQLGLTWRIFSNWTLNIPDYSPMVVGAESQTDKPRPLGQPEISVISCFTRVLFHVRSVFLVHVLLDG